MQPAVKPPADSARLFISREEAAQILGLSIGGLNLCMARGELTNTFIRLGRSVRFFRPALELLALGISTPQAVGEFCAGCGLDLAGLQKFLGGDDGGES